MQTAATMSTESSLPEPVNLVVSDVRGVLPLFGKSLVSIIDARERFLAVYCTVMTVEAVIPLAFAPIDVVPTP